MLSSGRKAHLCYFIMWFIFNLRRKIDSRKLPEKAMTNMDIHTKQNTKNRTYSITVK